MCICAGYVGSGVHCRHRHPTIGPCRVTFHQFVGRQAHHVARLLLLLTVRPTVWVGQATHAHEPSGALYLLIRPSCGVFFICIIRGRVLVALPRHWSSMGALVDYGLIVPSDMVGPPLADARHVCYVVGAGLLARL
jgi:hypothetical protein